MFETTDLIHKLEEFSVQNWTSLQVNQKVCADLLLDAHNRIQKQQFKDAELAFHQKVETKIRNDKIFWLDENLEDINTIEKDVLIQLNRLRLELKNFFRVSLQSLEAHFAFYEKGHFYQKHRDTTSKNNQRFISFVLYLNKNWLDSDGGEIQAYQNDKILFKIKPEFGQLLLFKSDIEHEVLQTNRDRISLTGWFRQ